MRLIDAIGLKQALAVSTILEDKKTIGQIIDEQPTIEPGRKTGRWIVRYECPNCGEERGYAFDTCPMCGRKLRGEKHETD